MEINCEEIEFIPKPRGQYAAKYTQDALREAIEKITNNEMSYGAASKIYNVPKATLHHKMRHPENLPKGATTVLTKEQEDELAEWLLLHADFGDPRTKQDIMIAAAEISQLDADSTHKFKNGIPSSGWMGGFLNRHPLCRERTPQGISKASAINTRDDFAGLWRNIFDYFEKTKQLDLLDKPELWWNADETCFEKDKVPKKVIARKGSKRVSRREMGPPKANTTVTYAFSAAGDHVEPLITLKDSNSSVAEIAFALGSVGANYGINQTESGWTKTESFYYFVSMHLHNQWEQKNCPKPRILTIDGYGAHLSPKLFRWCRRNAVIMIVLYPGATPFMQMCDTTMFSPMKQKHTQLYSQWRLKNPSKTMNDVEFVKLLKQINDAVIKKESIINGWRATGLQPFNFNNLNTDGLLSKSSNRSYDFKGYCIDTLTESVMDTNLNRSKLNELSNVALDPSFEQYMSHDEMSNRIHAGVIVSFDSSSRDNHYFNQPVEIDPVHYDVGQSSSLQQSVNIEPELVDVNMEDIPDGPLISVAEDQSFHLQEHPNRSLRNGPLISAVDQSFYLQEHPNRSLRNGPSISAVDQSFYLQEHPNRSLRNGPSISAEDQSFYLHEHPNLSLRNAQETSTNVQALTNNCVAFSEVAGPIEFLKSQSETTFDLSVFGIPSGSSNAENASKMGKLTEKIRRDVKQLGILCAASDKEKLINILIINQQLNVIDPPLVEETEPPEESRTIKSILKAPTMPHRVNKKRNMNLKVSYGVVTAKEVVQSIIEREAADQQQEMEREEDDIAKLSRENEIAAVEDELKHMRKLSTATRSEVAALNKEMIQKKKSKSVDKSDLKLQEATKCDKEVELKKYDDQLRQLREKLKNLKAINVETNKAVSLKRKNFEIHKKEMGNKVQPSITQPEIDDMELDSEPY